MNTLTFDQEWPSSWKYSYPYDLLEVYGEEHRDRGYAYAYQNRKAHTLDLVQLIGKPGDTILDVAAAQGNFSIVLAEMGYHVTWNDIREELSEYVRLKNNSAPITYKPGNVFDVRFDELFDIILATEIIEHVAHPDEFLANLAKLLKPGGYIIISTPLGSYFRNNLPKFSEFADPSVF